MRQRLTNWLGAQDSPKVKASGADMGGYSNLLSSIRRSAPGQWSQNLLKLSQHFTGPIYLAVHAKATQAAGSRFEVHERTDDPDTPGGKKQLPHYDPIVELFEDPNPVDTWHDLLYQTSQQKNLNGLSLTWRVPTRGGDVKEIYSLPTATCWPMPPNPEFPYGSYRVLPYSFFGLFGVPAGAESAGATIPAEQIVRIKNHHPLLRYDGYAALTAAALQIDTIEAIDKGRHTTQQLGCDQTLAIEFDSDTYNPDEADVIRIRAQLQALYAGPQNVGKLFIPPPGGKVSNISTVPKDMAYQEGWQQLLDFILAAIGVPSAVAGLTQNMSYATLYSSLRAFYVLSLLPELMTLAGSWNKHIVRPTWGRQYGLQIFPPEVKDEALEEMKFSNDLKAGVRTIKERRREEGLDITDDPWMEERATQTQQSPPGGSDREPKKPGQEEDSDLDNSRPNKTYEAIWNGIDKRRAEIIATALESAKTNGTAKPIKR